MTPSPAASRSASEMAAEIHVAPVPATTGPMPDTSPPAPRRPTSAPDSSRRNETGPRLDTTTTGRSAMGANLGAMRVVAAPDKFRGTATAAAVAEAVGRAAWEAGWDCDEVPLADGGEGTLEALGGANRSSTVT